MTEKEIKYENLSQNELIKKSNKEAFCNKKLQRRKKHNLTWKKINYSRIRDFKMSRPQSQIENRKHICKQKNT